MHDIAKWSHPWHELQRDLAAGFGAHAGGYAAGYPQTTLTASSLRGAIPPAVSWLVRAHSRPPPCNRPQDNCRITDR
jgi:hypothetical protein